MEFRLGRILRGELELDEVTVLHVAVVATLGEERKVAEAACELHLGASQIEIEVPELALHVSLNAYLALDAAPHGRGTGIVLGEAAQERLPLARVRETRGELVESGPVRRAFAEVGRSQITEELVLHAQVRNLESRSIYNR